MAKDKNDKPAETPAEQLSEEAIEEGTHNRHPSAEEQRRISVEAEQPAVQAAKAMEEGDEEGAREALRGNTKGYVDPGH